jgi:uroporphyrinogen decarboxylase
MIRKTEIKLKNDRLLRAIRHQPIDTTPVWIMRQAGRYLPEYRKIRQQAGSFMNLCKTPELACAVTLQPLARFPLDAAIVFSDILTIPDAMGLGLHFKEGEGPLFTSPLRSTHAIQSLGVPDPELSLAYVLDAIRMIQQELANALPLIGFCGSPWTLATYMVEGKANKSFPAIQQLMQEDPLILHQLLTKLAQSVALLLNAQIAAGVNLVMIFDTWGGLLNTENYKEFSLQYIQMIIQQIHPKVPIVVFTKNGSQWLELIMDTGCDVIGFDHQISLADARKRSNDKVAIQGNMNPELLLESPEQIRESVARILAEYGHGSGHIFNLGHGITPDVPPENVAVLVDAVHELGQEYHRS